MRLNRSFVFFLSSLLLCCGVSFSFVLLRPVAGTHQTAFTDFQQARQLLHPLPAPQAPVRTQADGDGAAGGGDDDDVDDDKKSKCGCQTSITHKFFSEAMLLKMVETMESNRCHDKRYVKVVHLFYLFPHRIITSFCLSFSDFSPRQRSGYDFVCMERSQILFSA
jgi:hypothetical protein